ncbi:MAG TPA: Zn-dependent alcohol dehydrogenase [Advenella kashmirensis]|uniref:Zn-dependent alcohol dehydrogenase n=1 Tax=Advenella kashmirensis TaxID=310575 RepID=A0A356LM54_9BURK|nr:Zn-dependent alcohol dehydrogenase [Advenella kashmirensis]
MQTAYVTNGANMLERIQIPIPVPGAREVLLKVKAVGICGSDHHIYLGRHPYVKYPIVQGHEFCAQIEQYGSDCAHHLPVGSQVVVEPLIRCGNCYACSIGRYNCCENLELVGVHRSGGFQEYLVVPEILLHTAPGLPANVAAFAEPLSIAMQACQRGRVTMEDRVLILGAGPIGLAAVIACKRLGARVAISDVVSSRLTKASDLGADLTFDAAGDSPERIREWSGGGVTVVLDAVGVAQALRMGVEVLRAAGRLVVIGISTQDLPIPISTIVAKEIDVLGSRNSAQLFGQAVAALYGMVDKIENLVTTVEGIDTLPEMMDYTIHNPQDVEKVVIKV